MGKEVSSVKYTSIADQLVAMVGSSIAIAFIVFGRNLQCQLVRGVDIREK
jgi:hypothetical protein